MCESKGKDKATKVGGDSPDEPFIKTLRSPDLFDLTTKIAESGLHAAMDAGTLRDIPIIGMIVGLAKAGIDIRSKLLAQKVAVFLSRVAKTTIEERETFLLQFDSGRSRRRFEGALLMLLDRASDFEKPRLIGNVMAACIRGRIDLRAAWRLCALIEKCYAPDLDLLQGFKDGLQHGHEEVAESLAAGGFLSQAGMDGGSAEGDGGLLYVRNTYGNLLVRHAFDE